jgi:hypothetical protein
MLETSMIEIVEEGGHLVVMLPTQCSDGHSLGYYPTMYAALEAAKAGSVQQNYATLDDLFGRSNLPDAPTAHDVKAEALRQIVVEFSYPAGPSGKPEWEEEKTIWGR